MSTRLILRSLKSPVFMFFQLTASVDPCSLRFQPMSIKRRFSPRRAVFTSSAAVARLIPNFLEVGSERLVITKV